MRKLPLLALLASLASAAPKAAPEATTPPAPASEATKPVLTELTAAERNYILETIASSVENTILAAESPLMEYKAEQRLIVQLERELIRISIPLDGLSPAQQRYHNAGIALLKRTIERLRQADPAQKISVFEDFQNEEADLYDNAPDECPRLHDDQPAFLAIADEIQFDQRFGQIMDLLYPKKEGVEPNKAEAIKQLKAYAADIRALKR